jgi:flagellar basal body-associated protein FliL
MSNKKDSHILKKNRTQEDGSVPQHTMDKKALSEKENVVSRSEYRFPESSADHWSQGPVSPTPRTMQKAELDLEGLKRKEGAPVVAKEPIPFRNPLNLKGWRPAGAVLVLATLVLSAAWFGYEFGKTQKIEEQETEASTQSVSPSKNVHPLSPIDSYHSCSLDPFVVPITSEHVGRDGFLRVTFGFSFEEPVLFDEIREKTLTIRSKITDLLFSKSVSELRSEGGKIALKREIRHLLNTILTQGTIVRVYFGEFFVL